MLLKKFYLFDFLGSDMPRIGVEIELAEHIYPDLLFYYLKLCYYVSIEWKACDFEQGFVIRLNTYQNVVNDILKHSDDKLTIGLLLVKGKYKTAVEYSLSGY